MSFAGVELPENIGESTPSQETPVESQNETKDLSGDKSPEEAKELLDLDKLEKFRFNGREWSSKDLKNAHLMHSDYTKKTQEISRERQYVDNFKYDLKTVLSNPSKLEELRKIYPKQYVEHAEHILSLMGKSNQQTPNPDSASDPRLLSELNELKGTVSEWKEAQKNAEVEKIQSWLDNQFSSLSKKYPYANQDAITMRAQYLSDNGTKIDGTTLDKLFKSNNEEVKALMDKMYKEKATKQLEVGNRGKDIGAGGGIPSSPAKKMKLNDVKNQILKEIESQ